MEESIRLEFEYAKKLRESNKIERMCLYSEAYTAVSHVAAKRFNSYAPEDRTAGTSEHLCRMLRQVLNIHDTVLEIGCGRGYTCMFLSPYVKSMIGTDISDSCLSEAKEVILTRDITNVEIVGVSGLELISHFALESFTAALSIDVLEHLHPDDAIDHIRQVYSILKPGGRYIIVSPNKLTGPHDVTKLKFPEANESLGFHLNETTYRDLSKLLREIGYKKIRSFISFPKTKTLRFSYKLIVFSELLYIVLKRFMPLRKLEPLLSIRLIAHKPSS